MAGEIRGAMNELRTLKNGMVKAVLKEIEAVKAEVAATHPDAMNALQLPKAELAAIKQEIQEIRDEFAPQTNGDPNPGPLPGTSPSSPAPSAPSAASRPADNDNEARSPHGTDASAAPHANPKMWP